jgi:fluoride ion exporter CrcB/FEX
MIRTLLLIAIGGGIGSVFRYLTSILVKKYYASIFPLATLITNVLGSFLIGIAIALLENMKLKVKISGNGKVVKQSIEPGTRVNAKTLIFLELS